MISQRIVTRIILAAAVIGAALLLPACAEFTREEQMALLRLDQPVDRSDMSVQQLIEAIQKATDPDKKYYGTEKYLLKQQIVSEQENKDSRVSLVYITEIRYAKPDKIRWTHYRNGIAFKISICKGGDAWDIDPEKKKSVKIEEGLGLNLFRTSTAMANPTKTYLDIFKTVEIASVREDGKRCYRLVCQAYDEAIAPYVIYVDAETFLPCKMETIVYHDDGTQNLYTSIPSDYKWYEESVRLPRTTIVKTGQGSQNVCTIMDFTLNPNIPDSDFELPKPFKVGEN